MTARADKPLSDKRQAFVDEYCINGHNATQAYKKAYPGCNGGWDKLCSRLMGNDGVKAAIRAYKAKVTAKVDFDRDRSLLELDEARLLAIKQGNPTAMISATKEKNAISWLHNQTIRTEGDNTADEQTPEQAEAETDAIAAYHRSFLRTTPSEATGAAPVQSKENRA